MSFWEKDTFMCPNCCAEYAELEEDNILELVPGHTACRLCHDEIARKNAAVRAIGEESSARARKPSP